MFPSWVKEINVYKKPTRSVVQRIGLIYPNSYSVGMSGLSIKLLYHLLNQKQEIYTERIFQPKDPISLPTSLETNRRLREFDLLAFTFQFELDYVNALRMLQISEIPIYSRERDRSNPVLLAGGPAITTNPNPMLDFFDLVFIGEFEEQTKSFLNSMIDPETPSLVDSINSIKGFYSPDEYSSKVKAVITHDLDGVNYPTAQVKPLFERSHKKGSLDGYFLQVSRGCPHRCNFCLIGRHFRPHRERSLTNLQELVGKGTIETQTKSIIMIGSSTADYSQINDLITFLLNQKMKFTLPSIRIDSGSEILDLLKQSKQRSLTIAPETGSEINRLSVGKKITNVDILNFVNRANKIGINNLKLYFILGLTDNHISEANDIIELIGSLKRKVPGINLNLSLTPLVVKKGTKIERNLVDYTSIEAGVRHLKGNINKKSKVKTFPTRWAIIQAITSLGGRDLSEILEKVAIQGGSYQSWKQVLDGDPLKYYNTHIRQD
jgi:radical SAM superfamily enzyme YgiQ (UPF0313 family)